MTDQPTDTTAKPPTPIDTPAPNVSTLPTPGPKPDVSLDNKTEDDPRQGLPPSVKVENADAPMELQQPAPGAKGPWIEYTGVGTLRIMDKAAWNDGGVDSDQYCEWNYLNKKRLPRSQFSDEELQYLLRVDDRFKIVEDQVAEEDSK